MNPRLAAALLRKPTRAGAGSRPAPWPCSCCADARRGRRHRRRSARRSRRRGVPESVELGARRAAVAAAGLVRRSRFTLAPGPRLSRSVRPSTAAPGDPTLGAYGAIPDPAQSYLPGASRHVRRAVGARQQPRQPRQLHLRGRQRARQPALHDRAARVSTTGAASCSSSATSATGRDPARRSKTAQPYRLDVWWQAARALGVSKSAVQISARAPDGRRRDARSAAEAHTDGAGQRGVAQHARSRRAKRRSRSRPARARGSSPSGLAAAGEEAPAAVKAMVAAGNRLLRHQRTSTAAGTAPRSTRCSPPMTAPRRSPTCCTRAGCWARSALDSTALAALRAARARAAT